MLKKLLVATAVAGAFALPALAADTANLNVQANVVGTCKFVSAPALDFGSLTPSPTPPTANASTNVTYWCTKNASYTLTSDDGQHAVGSQKRMKHASSSDYIEYSITPLGATGTGQGATQNLTLTINGTVLGSAYADAPVGAYSDIIGLSITP